jgi:hypothetical protein
MKRVAKAGYIETPSHLWQKLKKGIDGGDPAMEGLSSSCLVCMGS